MKSQSVARPVASATWLKEMPRAAYHMIAAATP